MVKYYGEVRGRSRGEYGSAELGAWFSPDEFLEKWGPDPKVASPAKDMSTYFVRAGSYVDCVREVSRELIEGLCVYHLGGATVAVRYRFHRDFSGHAAAGNLSVRLASNAPLGDVVQRLKKKFPYLKEDASIDDLPDF